MLAPTSVALEGVMANRLELGEATGIVLTSSGLVLTNEHVVHGIISLTARVGGTGRRYRAALVGTDPAADIALVQLEHASGLRTASIGSSSSVATGDEILTIGYPDSGEPALARGAVSYPRFAVTIAAEQGMPSRHFVGLIATDAPARPGFSGGPMVDTAARVVGIVDGGGTNPYTADTEPITSAIPIDVALSAAREIAANGRSTIPA
jgi:S1-C subfamily serine protease